MKEVIAARRHAEALLRVAEKRNETERILKEFEDLCEVLDEEPRLQNALALPILSLKAKEEVLKEIGERLGLSPTLQSALRNIVELRRVHEIDDIFRSYRALALDSLGRAVAFVRSAQPLADEETQALVSHLSSYLGKTVEVRVEIDPDLLAGVEIRVGDLHINNSLRHTFAKLFQELAKG